MTSQRILIKGMDLFGPEKWPAPAAVLVEGGKIARIGTQAEAVGWSADAELDASGLWLIPGLIELQINGAFGLDFTADPAALYPVASGLPRWGVTRFLPTIITAPLDRVAQAQAVFQAGPPPGFKGAVPLGWHVEGPYLNPERKGAHSAEYLRSPNLAEIATWSREQGVRLVTLAPELEGAEPLIRTLAERGVVVSAGHSMATVDQANQGFQAGLRYATHLFNAMSPLNQFDPGLPGAVLAQPGWPFGLIVDGVHVHSTLVNLVWQLSGPGRLTLVSDAMAALGMPPGRYKLGAQTVQVDATRARLDSGILAGSILDHPAAIKNLMAFTGCSLPEALTCLTTTPAAVLGLGAEIGRVAPGFRADLVLVTPDLQVVHTFVDGERVYSG